MSDNENIDLKARLGRKRLRTSSQKDLESSLPGQEQGYERPPTGEMRAASDDGMPAPGMPSVPAPGVPVMSPGAPAPAAAAPVEIDFAVGKTSKVTLILIAVCCALPALGLGYCSGHRVEQNNLVNKATDDAKSLKATLDLINNDLAKFATAFAAPPTKVGGWLTLPQDLALKDPDFGELAGFKLNYIPTPKQRKEFMGNLVTFYALLPLIKEEYGNFVGHVMALESAKGIVDGMDKLEEKQIVEENKDAYKLKVFQLLNNFTAKSIQIRNEAAVKEGAKFMLLWDNDASKIVPVQAEALVCPKEEDGTTCKKGKENEKVFMHDGKEFVLKADKDAKVAETKMAIYLRDLAPNSLNLMVKTEVVDPMLPRWANAIDSFYKLQSYIKDANELAAKLIPVLDAAAKRKKRGFI